MIDFNNKTGIPHDLNIGNDMYDLIEELYPITRSITGNGVRKTLARISEIIPLKIHEVESGTKVLDWEIPLEWNISDAWIKDENGKKIVDFKNSNLHILNYSIPVHTRTTLGELKKHLYTLPEYPDWVPYRTSYHNEEWGFCMSYSQYKDLEEGDYEVMIDSSLEKGFLTYGEYYIKGKIDEEVLISTHICHPSLANDNLSGIALSAYLANFLKNEDPYYSYRFLFIPGTIGSITWLSLNEGSIEKIKYGLVLTLLGDNNRFNYKKARRSDAQINTIVEYCLQQTGNKYKITEFYPYGYDERQFCSPGYNLPVGRLSRSEHGQFPEYHTSADNLNFIKKTKLTDSYRLLQKIIYIIENNKKYLNLNPKGEPQLGKRGLFKKIGGQSEAKDFQMALLWVLNQSDGKNSLLDISIKSMIEFYLILKAAKELERVNLLKVIS